MCFPLEVFKNAGRALVGQIYLDALFRPAEKEQGKYAMARSPENFSVILTSHFSPEDFEEFLFSDDGYGLPQPKEQYAFIIVKDEDKDKDA